MTKVLKEFIKNLEDPKTRLEEFFKFYPDLNAKKSLGQNFLISKHVVEQILSCAFSLDFKQVVEIGPGPGALTQGLAAGFDKNKIYLIELDHQIAQHWRLQGFEVFEGDALKWDWAGIHDPKQTLLLSNLPYQISSSLVVDRCGDPVSLAGMVLMFQKEVAQRLTSQARREDYGFLSVVGQSFWKIDLVCDAGPRDFDPSPKVASRVLCFLPRDWNSAYEKTDFIKFVKAGFSQRRKFLKKNLESQWFSPRTLESWSSCLSRMKLKESVRAEELSPAQWLELFEGLLGL